MDRSIEQDGRTPDERLDGRLGVNDHPARHQSPTARQNDEIVHLRGTIDRLTQDRPTMSELIDRLERAGVRSVPSLQKSGRLNGMSYVVNESCIRGCDLGRGYTALGLQKRKGVQYDPLNDRLRLEKAAKQARDNPLVQARPEPRERGARRREYDGLSATQRAALWEIGRFRTVLAEDLVRIQYSGDRTAWRQDFIKLASKKLAEQRSVVIATHSKTHGRIVKSLSIVVLTKSGKDL